MRTQGNATDFGDMLYNSEHYAGGASNATRGIDCWWYMGQTYTNRFFNNSSTGDVYFGDLT